jgi:hypothetical protein
MLFYWFSLGAENGEIIWSANCDPEGEFMGHYFNQDHYQGSKEDVSYIITEYVFQPLLYRARIAQSV